MRYKTELYNKTVVGDYNWLVNLIRESGFIGSPIVKV